MDLQLKGRFNRKGHCQCAYEVISKKDKFYNSLAHFKFDILLLPMLSQVSNYRTGCIRLQEIYQLKWYYRNIRFFSSFSGPKETVHC